MKKYRTREIVEAAIWSCMGDVPEADITLYVGTNSGQECIVCKELLGKHGKMLFPDNSYDLVCPGDWMIKYSNGKIYPCDNKTFTSVYEEVN